MAPPDPEHLPTGLPGPQGSKGPENGLESPDTPGPERRVQVGLLLGMLLLLAVGAVSYWSVHRLTDSAAVLRDRDRMAALLQQVEGGAADVCIATEAFALSDDEADLPAYRSATNALEISLEALEVRVSRDPVQRDAVTALRRAVTSLNASTRLVVDPSQVEGQPALIPEGKPEHRMRYLAEIRKAAERIGRHQDTLLERMHRETESRLDEARLVVGLVAVLVFVGVLFSTLSMNREVARSQAAEMGLRRARDDLESRVQERTSELDRSMQSLHASEARLAQAQKISQTGSYEWELQTGVQTWSDELRRIFGLGSTAKASVEQIERLVHPEDLPRLQEVIHRVRRGEACDALEFRIVRSPNELRQLLGNAVGITDDRGVVQRILGTIQDVTERKRDEVLIRSQQRLSEALLRLAKRLERSHRVAEAMTIATEEIYRTLGLPSLWFLQYSDDGDRVQLVHKASAGEEAEASGGWVSVDSHPLLGSIRAAREWTLMRTEGEVGSVAPEGWPDLLGKDALHVPILLAGNQRGAIGVSRIPSDDHQELGGLERQFLLSAMANIGVVLDRVLASEARDRMTQALLVSEERLQMASRVGGAGVFEENSSTGEFYASPLLAEIVELPSGVRPLQSLLDRIRPEDSHGLVGFLRRLQDPSRGRRAEHECRLGLADGGIRWLRIQAQTWFEPQGGRGRPVRTIGTVVDITERKAAEAVLRASIQENNDLRTALDQHALVAITSPLGRISFVNDKFCAVSRYDRSELLGQDHRLINSGHHTKEFFRDLWNTIAAGRVWQGDIRNRAKDGSCFWVATTIVPFLDDRGIPARYMAIHADITERKRAEEQLRQTQKLESIGTLAGGIAHDFNNILSAILGNAELARMDLDPHHEAYGCLEEIRKAGQRAKGLVQQILAFGPRQPSEQKAVPLQALVEEMSRLLRATLPAGVELQIALDPLAPPVLGDANQLHQALFNLCTNAWHSLDDQPGTISIRLDSCTLDHPAAAALPGTRPGRHVRVEVADTGHGIELEAPRHIFEPFFTTKHPGKGTGLGLTMVQAIVQSHHGSIVVDSIPRKGSTFILYLPATDAAPEMSTAPEPATGRGTGQRILYLDDEEQLVSLGTRMLSRAGFQIFGFTHPGTAIEAFSRNPMGFDVVITDHNMPEQSGLQVAEELLRIRPDITIVLCSGFLTDEPKEKARHIGIHHVLYKPNAIQELTQSIYRIVQDAQAPRPTG